MDDRPIWYTWKTIDNVKDYFTMSDNPILKYDSHHDEIVDITDGLVVNEHSLDYYEDFTENQKLVRGRDVGDVFCSTDWSKH